MRFHNFSTRPQHQVKGIAQNNLSTDLNDIPRQHTFHRAIGSHGHKCRCLNLAAGEGQLTATGFAISGADIKLHKTVA